MILNLSYDEYFPQPIEEVWRAITDPEMLAAWLMENDFEAIVGKRFTMNCGPIGDWNGLISAEVLELVPPTRMVWSWHDGIGNASPSRVIFELSRQGSGTRLILRHVGDSDDTQAQRLEGGWPEKFASLRSTLGSREPQSS
jgi:uncharacterized protein YndB with AHSA1/START domain